MTRTDAVREHPKFPWLSLDDPVGLESFLRDRGWLAAGEHICRCQKPGDGNMNLTIRAITDRRSLIVKQARPWVEKYDHIPAPWERIEYECRFYRRIASVPEVAERMPRLLGADMEARAMLLEDLVDARSFASLYADDSLAQDELRQLAHYLRSLHEATRGSADPGFANLAMRRLNHQHIFEVPMTENNGIDLERLECGLTSAAARLREDATYRGLIRYAGQRYLSAGTVLVHGDYFPGSWLRTAKGVFVIDPEFCFYGDPEVDLGCAIAHFRLAQQPREHALSFLQAYAESSATISIQWSLLTCFAAAEVMRRLIGVAQLPLAGSNLRRAELLDRSHRAMIDQSWEELWD
ncbi:MAG: phosphotransferase [Planctomycetia bacterium]|nr:phosphotransferase [Planctomycetia bacterium]